MKSPEKSVKKTVDIADYYAINVRPIWQGLTQESAAFWWLCIYLFFEYVRPQSIYTAIDIIPWTQISLLMVLVTVSSDKTVKWVKNTGNVYFILFYIIVFLSCMFAFKPSASWGEINIVVNWIILYFLVITVINTEKRFIIFLLLFLLANFKMSQHGFFTYATRGFGYAKWGVAGAPGWFANAGDFGIQMAVYLPLAAAFVLALRSNWGRLKRLLFYSMPVTAIFAILATSSRSAQLGVAAAVLWLLLINRSFKVIFAAAIAGWMLYALMPTEMLQEYQQAGEDSTSQARFILWDFSMYVAKENPLTGIGYENLIPFCRSHFQQGIPGIGWCMTTHNTYIYAAAELGYPGLLAYVLLILFILSLDARTRKIARDSNEKFFLYIAYGLDMGLVSYLVSSFFYTVLFYPIFWLQMAMAVALHEVLRKKLESAVQSR